MNKFIKSVKEGGVEKNIFLIISVLFAFLVSNIYSLSYAGDAVTTIDGGSKAFTVYALKISPSSKGMYSGGTQVFTAKICDKLGNELSMDPSKVVWDTDYGNMNPYGGSASSTFTAPSFPKYSNLVTVTYDGLFSADATVRVYPNIGSFSVNVVRTWNIWPNHFSVRLSQLTLKNAYAVDWGSGPDYPTPMYQYFNCRDGNFYQNTPAYTFPDPLFWAPWVIANGLNATEFVDVYFDSEEGDWPAAGYNSAQDGYTWDALNVYGTP
ncbi:MAG: hypothetical protein WC081_03005 [Candidatus Ratteibacteria bacterium]|jgi:hypothetical protein